MSEKEMVEAAKKYAEEAAVYKAFMFDKGNAYNCTHCPENIGHNGHECCGHPCGQQNCWVMMHCKEAG